MSLCCSHISGGLLLQINRYDNLIRRLVSLQSAGHMCDDTSRQGVRRGEAPAGVPATTKIHLEIQRRREGSLCHGRVQNTGKETKCSDVVSS